MSEERGAYLLKPMLKSGTLDTELDTVRAQLEEIERRLIPLLVTVQKALGKEPSISTRAERRTR
jgi:hypothetical protein